MIKSVLAISAGASAGAVLRWLSGLALNKVHPLIPLGTLVANLAGGFLIGFFLSYFAMNQQLSPEWRLLVITGFLGALTTFSTFSAEVVMLMQQGRFSAAFLTVALHLLGSLGLTFLGMLSYQWLRG